MGIVSLQYTPGQLRDTVGLSVETYRHWKRVLPPFAERGRSAPRFSIGDLIGACVMQRLTDACSIRVGSLREVSSEIMRVCNASSWASFEGRTLVVDMAAKRCRILKGQADNRVSDVAIVCNLDSILRDLRDALLRSQNSVGQTHLMFPPTDVSVRVPRSRGGS